MFLEVPVREFFFELVLWEDLGFGLGLGLGLLGFGFDSGSRVKALTCTDACGLGAHLEGRRLGLGLGLGWVRTLKVGGKAGSPSSKPQSTLLRFTYNDLFIRMTFIY